ncbi:MAG: ribonuclease R family protein [Candidatus Puniceispirillales bacterium]
MELTNKEILPLKVTLLDNDGYAVGKITEKNHPIKTIEIPFNKNNLNFSVDDNLLVELELKHKKYKVTKIIKKIEIERKYFFAKVRLNSKNKFLLQVLERGKQSKEVIEPIIPKDFLIKNGDIVKAKIASGQILKKLKIKKIKANKRHKLRTKIQQTHAEIIEVIGSSLDPKVFSYLAVKEHDLKNDFDINIKNEIEKLDIIDTNSRADLRTISLVTIDGEDAKDFDDAVYAEQLSKKEGWRILVSIADVSFFVKANSYLDKEARHRGNSVYLPNYVIPMLPEELSNNLCSLKPDQDRACLTVEIILDNNGQKKSHSFFRSIINSKKRLTYNEVEDVIKSKFLNQDFETNILTVIKSLHNVYKILEGLREKRGALNLELPEKKILFDEEGWPQDVKKIYGVTSNKIIEELMILANVAAAEEINKVANQSIYRSHEPPSQEKYKSLIDLIGKPLSNILIGKVPHPSLMNKILSESKGSPEYETVNQSILRSQSQAKYENKNKSHFGLALKNYVHFTSPIRRYADLLVHRQIIEIINNNNVLSKNKQLFQHIENNDIKSICDHISNTERKSIVAERKTIDRYISLLYQKKINEIVDCSITSIHKFGVFVSIDGGIADALLPIRELPNDWYNYDQVKQTLIGERSGSKFYIGMQLKVKIIEVVPLTGSITVKWKYNKKSD